MRIHPLIGAGLIAGAFALPIQAAGGSFSAGVRGSAMSVGGVRAAGAIAPTTPLGSATANQMVTQESGSAGTATSNSFGNQNFAPNTQPLDLPAPSVSDSSTNFGSNTAPRESAPPATNTGATGTTTSAIGTTDETGTTGAAATPGTPATGGTTEITSDVIPNGTAGSRNPLLPNASVDRDQADRFDGTRLNINAMSAQ